MRTGDAVRHGVSGVPRRGEGRGRGQESRSYLSSFLFLLTQPAAALDNCLHSVFHMHIRREERRVPLAILSMTCAIASGYIVPISGQASR